MENYDLKALHTACIEWAKNPTWKLWQEDLKMTAGIFDDVASIDSSIGGETIYLDFGLEVALGIDDLIHFAWMAGIDIEQFRKPQP